MRNRVAVNFAVITALVTTFGLLGQSYAGPVAYDEAVSGDIDQDPTFSLDFGTNTVAGRQLFTTIYTNGNSTTVSDDDNFGFSLPGGARLTSVAVRTDFTDTTSGTKASSRQWGLATFVYDPVEDQTNKLFLSGTTGNCFEFVWTGGALIGPPPGTFCPFAPAGGNLFDDLLPVFEGLYFLQTIGGSITGNAPLTSRGGELAYTFEFEVQRVPEPGTLSILGLGLAGLAAARRRRR